MATVAKPKLIEARQLMLDHLDLHPGKAVDADLDPAEAGIVGDRLHGSGYHLSRQDNKATDYSVDESPRDRKGNATYASGVDYGFFRVVTSKGTFDLYDYNAWLIALCKAGDPDTADLREVIYTLDGNTVRRWDRLGIRSAGDSSHLWHTHHSEFRDATGQRMVNLARRWLQHIGLLAGEDDDVNADQDRMLKATNERVLSLVQGREKTVTSWAQNPAGSEDVWVVKQLKAMEDRLGELEAVLDERPAAEIDYDRLADAIVRRVLTPPQS